MVSLQERLRGYQAALQEADIPYRPEYVLQGALQPGGRMPDDPPDARYASAGNQLWYGVCISMPRAVQPVLPGKRLVRIPEIFRFCLGDPDWVSLYSPQLAHLELPPQRLERQRRRFCSNAFPVHQWKNSAVHFAQDVPKHVCGRQFDQFIRPDDPDGKEEKHEKFASVALALSSGAGAAGQLLFRQ